MEVIATAFGGPEVLQLRPSTHAPDQTELESGHVLVENAYAGVNFMDNYFRSGELKFGVPPLLVGDEGAGVVVKVGPGVDASLLGKHVAYYGFGGIGSYASFTVVNAQALRVVPEGVSDKEAAAAIIQGLTAHYLTDGSYACGPQSTVVVHAAAGGTGLLVCQMAKLRGARVIGVCGGAAKAALATAVGHADAVIDYVATPDWAAAVRALAPAGVDAVYDGVGPATFQGSLSVLRPRGYLISFGHASGPAKPIAPFELTRAGSVYLQTPNMLDYVRDPQEADRRSAELFGWIASKQIQLTIGNVYALSEAGQAQNDLESHQSTGKLLMDCTRK